MTEIPEHLLKRSRERRAALGLGGDAPRGRTGERPTRRASSRPRPPRRRPRPRPAPAAGRSRSAKPEPPKPEPAYIQAAKRRKRIPYWAMPVLAALPLWGYIYVRTLEPPPAGEDDPLVLGADGLRRQLRLLPRRHRRRRRRRPAFVDGAVLETFPDWRDQAAWVRLGTDGWPAGTYGATDKPVRQRRHHAGAGPRSPTRRSPRSCCTSASFGGEDITEAEPRARGPLRRRPGRDDAGRGRPGPALRGGGRDRGRPGRLRPAMDGPKPVRI